MKQYTKICARLTATADDETHVDCFFDSLFTAFYEGCVHEPANAAGPSHMAGPFKPREHDDTPVYLYELQRLSPTAVTYYTYDTHPYWTPQLKNMLRLHPDVSLTLDWADRSRPRTSATGMWTSLSLAKGAPPRHTSADPALIADDEFNTVCYEPSGTVAIG
jgi:hypothetical protein